MTDSAKTSLGGKLTKRHQLRHLINTRIPISLYDNNIGIPRAEREGFEPPVHDKAYAGLANQWFQPLTHLSGFGLPARKQGAKVTLTEVSRQRRPRQILTTHHFNAQ